MSSFLCIIATINLLLGIVFLLDVEWLEPARPTIYLLGLLLSGALLVELINMNGSKSPGCVQTELQTPVAFCTAQQCEPAKPLVTPEFKPTF